MCTRSEVTHSSLPAPEQVLSTYRVDASIMLPELSLHKACGLVLCGWLQGWCLKSLKHLREYPTHMSHLLNTLEFGGQP